MQPAGVVWFGCGVEVCAGGVKLGGIGVGAATDLHNAGDAGLGAAGVVEEGQVAYLHGVAHEVAGLVVAHAYPGDGLLRVGYQVVNAAVGGFRLH